MSVGAGVLVGTGVRVGGLVRVAVRFAGALVTINSVTIGPCVVEESDVADSFVGVGLSSVVAAASLISLIVPVTWWSAGLSLVGVRNRSAAEKTQQPIRAIPRITMSFLILGDMIPLRQTGRQMGRHWDRSAGFFQSELRAPGWANRNTGCKNYPVGCG